MAFEPPEHVTDRDPSPKNKLSPGLYNLDFFVSATLQPGTYQFQVGFGSPAIFSDPIQVPIDSSKLFKRVASIFSP